MSIGIIGAGRIGQTFAALLARHGIPAVIASSRGPETLAGITTGSIRAGTREEAAALMERLGAFPMDLGPLAAGARLMQFPGGPLPGQNPVRFS